VTPDSLPKATLICTVYNEGQSIQKLLDSIIKQNTTPDEAIFVDGGSTDQTTEIIQNYSEDHDWIKLVIDEGCNIAEGRNTAVKHASNDYIVSTDGGCILDPKWYEEMCKAFQESSYVIGMWTYQAETLFEEVQGKIVSSAHTVKELKKGNRGPSSRSVGFSVQAWKDADGYPEDLYTGEDSKFNAQIMASGYEPAIAEDAMVYWQMRPNWKALYDQFYTYGEGDAKGGNLFTHPSEKLGVTKNFWLLSTGSLTSLLTFSLLYFVIQGSELALYNAVILTGLYTIPILYYKNTLTQILSENGLKAFLTGIGISQVKYWGWLDGFLITLLKKPSLIPHQIREARKLK
jgi:glycosyltransferase involved in cell wall biosynthesis